MPGELEERLEVERRHCLDHTGLIESILSLRQRITLLIWIMGGCGSLLLAILIVLMSNSSSLAKLEAKYDGLDQRLLRLEISHPYK